MVCSFMVRVIEVKDATVKSGQVAMVLSLNGLKHARTRGKPIQNKAVFFDEEFSFESVPSLLALVSLLNGAGCSNISETIQDMRLELVPTGRRKAAAGHYNLLLTSLTPNTPVWSSEKHLAGQTLTRACMHAERGLVCSDLRVRQCRWASPLEVHNC